MFQYVTLLILQALPIERCPQFRDQPPGSTATYNGKCYIFYNRQPLNLRESLAFCRSRGGSLVDESNPALQGFISWELWRRHRYYMIDTLENIKSVHSHCVPNIYYSLILLFC